MAELVFQGTPDELQNSGLMFEPGYIYRFTADTNVAVPDWAVGPYLDNLRSNLYHQGIPPEKVSGYANGSRLVVTIDNIDPVQLPLGVIIGAMVIVALALVVFGVSLAIQYISVERMTRPTAEAANILADIRQSGWAVPLIIIALVAMALSRR